MKKIIASILVLGLAASPAAVLAQNAAPGNQGVPNAGAVDAAGGKRVFTDLDTNADGKLSFDELASLPTPITEETFATLDTDQDGGLTEDDARAAGLLDEQTDEEAVDN